MKKIFWGAMYVLAAALLCLTAYLYLVPEKELPAPEPAAEETVPMPVITVNGADVSVGETELQALLSAGLTLRAEKDGEYLAVLATGSDAAPRTQYRALLFDGESCLADIAYTNGSEEKKEPAACVVDELVFDTGREGYEAAEVSVGGVPIKGLKITDVPEKFPGFVPSEGSGSEYILASMTEEASMAAFFRAADGSTEIGSFGVKNYMPGSGME